MDCSTNIRKHLLPLMVLGGAWAVYAGPLLLPQSVLYLTDTFCQDVPLRIHAAELVRAGEFPHWTTLLQCGFPLFADGQTGVLYPLFLLYVVWPVPETHDLFMAIHFLLAGLFSYLFLIGRSQGPWASVLGAATFMGGSYLQSNHVVPGVLAAACWLPLALHLIDRYLAGQRRALWLCVLVNATMLLAGHVHVALISYTLQGAWLWYRLGLTKIRELLVASAICFVLPLFICAIQMWPTYAFLSESTRSAGSLDSRLTWQTFTDYGIEWKHLVLFVWPDYLGKPEEMVLTAPKWVHTPWEEGWVLFHGYGAVLLAPWAVFAGRPRREVWFWLAVVVVGVLLSAATPLRWVLFQVPIFNLFRWPARYMLLFSFGVSVLTAMGATAMWRNWSDRVPLAAPWWAHPLLAIVLCGAIYGAVYRSMERYVTDAGFYNIHSSYLVAASQSSDHLRILPAIRALYRYWNANDDQLRRNAAALPVSYNLLFNVPAATLFDQGNAVSPRAMSELVRFAEVNFLKIAAVTHISSPQPLEQLESEETDVLNPLPLPSREDLELVDEEPYIYRYRDAFPRAWMSYRPRYLPTVEERLGYVCLELFDPGEEVVLDSEVPACGIPSRPAHVEFKQHGQGQITIFVDTSADGVLVLADTFSRSFEAMLDGEPVQIMRANRAFRGVFVPAGVHEITMTFNPIRFYQGAVCSSIALLVCLVGLWRAGTRPGQEEC